jgi:O-antigen/teichoic acid export membrane protein
MKHGDLKKVPRNSALLFSSRLIDMAAVVLTNVVIARSLGAASFGQYSFISAYVVSITMLSYFGLDNLTMRNIARHADKAPQYLGTVIVARWILSGLAALLILAGLPFIGLEQKFLPALSLLTVSEIIGAFVTVQTAVFKAREQMKYDVYITILWRLTSLILISLGAYRGFGITGLCTIFLTANLTRALFAVWITRTKFFKPDFSEVNLMLRGIFKDAAVLGAAMLITNWLFRSAQLAIKFLLGPEPVAYFQVSYAIILQVSTVALSIMLALFPVISRKARPDQESLRRISEIYTGVSKLLICLGLVFSAGLMLLSRPIILTLFGPEYLQAVEIFRILLTALVPIFIYSLHALLFVAYNKQYYIIISRGISFILVCGLYFLFIPRFGAIGAACAYVIVSILIGLAEALLLKYRVLHSVTPPLRMYFLNIFLSASLAATLIFEYSLLLRMILLLFVLSTVLLQLKKNYAIFIRYRQRAAQAAPCVKYI